MKKIYFITLGCPRNLVDSEMMLAKLLEKNYVLVNEMEKADIFIVNTCAFLQSSQDEAFEVLEAPGGRLRSSSK